MSTAEAAATPNISRPPRAPTSGSTRPRGARRGGVARPGAGSGPFSKSSQSSDWASAQEDPESSEEIAQLKAKYANQLKSLREIFPDWTVEDLVYPLQEVDGDLALATDRIAGGHATQWGQVKKKTVKDKAKSTARTETPQTTATRGRGRGASERGTDRGTRGRGESRGGRARGRGEARSGRGRGGATVTSDATSNAATIGSDETPSAWPEGTSVDDTVVQDTEVQDVNGINGTKAHEETAPAPSVWGVIETKAAPTTETPTPAINGSPVKKAPPPSASRQSRIVDPTAKFSWASIVKPVAPPPTAKPAPQTKPAPLSQQISQEPPAPGAQQPSSRPSTRGQDITEEPAQTIHDPFTSAAEPAKPKVQLPQQPALPYIPSVLTQPTKQETSVSAQLPPSEPLTSRNLDLLEDQQPSQAPQPPTPSMAAHRASPAPKTEGPPGLTSRFARNSRDTPVIMPGIAPSVGGMQLQFGSIDLNQDSEIKSDEAKEEPIHAPQELEPQQPTPSQQRASPAAAQSQTSAPVTSQRMPSGQQPQAPQPYQPSPSGFGGLIPGQAQRFTQPAPGLTQSKEFSGFPYEQHYQGQSGSGYGDYAYGGGQGQYERDYYGYYGQGGPQGQASRVPPSTSEPPRTQNQSATPSNTETATPSQFGSTTPASTSASSQPTPAPSTHTPHHPQHPQYNVPYWTHPYYANQMYQHYSGMPYYNQHKGMYQSQGYGGPYGGQGYDRFASREYDSFGRGGYGQGQTQGGQSSQGPVMQQHNSQQGQGNQDDSQTSEVPPASSSQGNTQGQGQGYQGYQSGAGRSPYGPLGSQGSSSSQPQYNYPQSQSYGGGYGGPGGYQSQGNTPSQGQSGQGSGTQQPGRQQQQGSGWNQFSHH